MIAWIAKILNDARWRMLVVATVALVIAVSIGGFVFVAHEMAAGDYLPVEEQILRSFRRANEPARIVGPPWFEEVCRDVSALGSAVTLTTMTVFVLGYLVLRRGYAGAVLVFVSAAGGYGLSALLKNLYARARPDAVPHLSYVSSGSFPSGHSMLASVIYLTLGAILAETALRRREKVYFVTISIFLSLMVGLSRVALGVHYPSDVLGGWAAGTAWALLCWTGARCMKRRGSLKPTALDRAEA